MSTLFRVENLRVAYPGQRLQSESNRAHQWAVDDVSFTLAAGERLGLVGESGCGKSTLGRAAMRLLSPSTRIEGRVAFAGDSVLDLSPAQLRRFRGEAVALVFQDPMTRLDPLMTVKDHCLETLRSHQTKLSTQQAKTRVLETLEAVKIPANRWTQYPHEFSGGMRQRVAIALALLLNPKMIVADEPTTSLDVTVAAQILRELTRLCQERQMALLLISHDLTLVGEYCDRLAVMYQGKIVETGPVQKILQHPQHPYTRSLLKSALHLQATPTSNQIKTSSGQALLRLHELKQYYTLESNFIARLLSQQDETIKAVDGVTLDIQAGETLGLVGESGCGKSTLSRTILQLVRPTSGTVQFLGKDLTALAKRQLRQQRREIQMIFQDPHACLNPLMTVGQSVVDPLLIHHIATPEEAKVEAKKMLKRVGLAPDDYYERYPADLSGGQQQRVAIARALITHPKLLICDEPVSMLDASIQTQVLELMLELKKEFNLTYLFITHDLWVARFFCDRIAVMNAGRIVELGPTAEIFSHPQHPYTQTLLQAAPLLARYEFH
ncbi:ABC transporter, ATP-binding protein (cluster 5, nickel/peptides/opines) / ABC transporter, ATP-binding protein (cluster 5, nickel/peptides/opines) [uncultured Synechococcales cyanobacterium]|uniref:ABC transporter, ATP-binding protein (Cluster 5, nickel/peptides/opines) / ABC transporter, ATP-binding protein (Cluster 5, nickel/peptides/opines) n=1 Tax=uncultured Synechococcales cyanobacterium TaxID=1936017 RepID=A0A6J4UT96_9CYAN|nr:ABC transporter, ATP-binding protein (cluster 5, nickel/peptides/opines) / ABC transporter, ATP-binding protein (cluster 5, nickel/peptides/opines) [uncultured Synechococcales cyanobacterium]